MYLIVKNIIDRVLALLLLLVLIIIPIIPITMLLIFIYDYKSVFFIQQRVGFRSKKFNVIKFRSMTSNADKIIKSQIASGDTHVLDFKGAADQMVTPIGRFIRKTSIDELPQLINILKGDMAIIGPRPLQEMEVDEFSSLSRVNKELMKQRLEVKPGLLCYWQITKNKNDMPFEDRMKMDVDYAKNLSFMEDLKILVQGIKTVILGNNM